MDAGRLLRDIRREHDWSQRRLAAELGVDPAAVARWESGARRLPLPVLERAATRVGLEVALVGAAVEPGPEVRRHLLHSTSMRLRLACGGPPTWSPAADPPLWRELADLAREGPVVLAGATALAVWLPLAPLSRLDVRREPTAGLVRVALGGPLTVHVPAPDRLAREPACADRAPELRGVAALLDAEQRRDRAERRPAAHRQPRESCEAYELFHRPQYDDLSALPDPRESRAWRLHGPAGLAQWVADRRRLDARRSDRRAG